MATTIENNAAVATRQIPLKRQTSLEDSKKKLYRAAKDMESLFLYQIIKAMRKTIPENELTQGLGFGSGLGKDIYGEIFDEELAKKMAGDGERSLANLLYKSLEKTVEKPPAGEKKGTIHPTDALPKARYLKISNDSKKFIELKPESRPLPLKGLRDRETESAVPQGALKSPGNTPGEQAKIDLPTPDAPKSEAAEIVSLGNASKQAADTVMGRYGDIIRNASDKYRLSPELIESVIKAESAGDPEAISPAGAKGLMQLADTTASDMGVKNAFDPQENIHAGAKYLRGLIDRFGDLKKALAAYNSGPETVKRYNGIPPYQETRKYVQTVINSLPDKRHYYE